ncbi:MULTISPECIES: DNA double-strand break repair nuclease NurA [Trichocoleus]|uniref:DNA double-strand break repair nuclease NurA n=1 Tax=Trichocoleus desertorum GB2-A4 TaxID=2933944 RepID=A0ABV0JDH6_9CYAN|nr:DNA double-strand break repair nuclease NurA [Trichocoleus sp. FACHB-46]MBD1860872.1 DNA double-strand break repair nuclease NurA [Trichocoleus sp. FACHB-46]
MLDLTKLAQQMQGISQHLADEATASRQRLELAQKLLTQAQSRQAELVLQRQTWSDRLGFAAAEPVEPLTTRVNLGVAPAIHTAIATDGSQIAPSHHEIAYCYLINVGRVVLHYGQSLHPLLDSLPEVFYRPEDLYVSRQWGIRTEEWMGHRRTVSEATVLADLACQVKHEVGSKQDERQAAEQVPLLAMVDGSLIYWFLEALPNEARDRLLPEILQAWEQLRLAKIPLIGYLSASRSGEALNFLRLQTCPHPAPDCATYCPGQSDRAPCHVFDPLRDIALWSAFLEPGQRSPLWRSSARILDLYGPHNIYFCYVHVGTEIARVEFPAWVAEDTTLLEMALSLTLAQVQKGYGYPVVLAEAHNQAVVRGGDRSRFFALLEQQMIRAGLRNIGTSYKEARKRGSIA